SELTPKGTRAEANANVEALLPYSSRVPCDHIDQHIARCPDSHVRRHRLGGAYARPPCERESSLSRQAGWYALLLPGGHRVGAVPSVEQERYRLLLVQPREQGLCRYSGDDPGGGRRPLRKKRRRAVASAQLRSGHAERQVLPPCGLHGRQGRSRRSLHRAASYLGIVGGREAPSHLGRPQG